MANHYAGVGVRKDTPDQLEKCYRIGSHLAQQGWVLHTGLAEGADQKFCLGALTNHGKVILHSPFKGYKQSWLNVLLDQFRDWVSIRYLDPNDTQALDMVQQYHPAWNELTQPAKLFHACNYRIRVSEDGSPVILTVALQGARPQEQEFGYRLNRGLSIPSILIRGLPLNAVKDELAHYPGQPETLASPEGVMVELECWNKRDLQQVHGTEAKMQLGDPTQLLPVTNCTMSTLWGQTEELKQKFKARERAACPCCGQSVNLRRTTVNADMARWLIRLIRIYFENGRDWVVRRDHPELSTAGGDYSKPKYWKLIEQRRSADVGDQKIAGERGSGVWRPTAKGIAYALGQTKIPDYCLTYNDQVYSFSSAEISITEVLQDTSEYSNLVDGLEKLAYPP